MVEKESYTFLRRAEQRVKEANGEGKHGDLPLGVKSYIDISHTES